MRSVVSVLSLTTEQEWDALSAAIGGASENPLMKLLLERLREAGVQSCIIEPTYIDRDFSAAFSAFYSTLFRPYQKYCSRLNFFTEDLGFIRALGDPLEVALALEERAVSYTGFVVLRPLLHAPISAAYLSVEALRPADNQEISVRAKRTVHVLGTALDVTSFPLTQQDTRVGACAQASIWMAGRHFHHKHGAAWYSMPDITANALKPTDSAITRSLPAGSDYLTTDNMVRALRGMGRHPVFYAPHLSNGQTVWGFRPKDIISRYVDSGIPVIVGVQKAGTAIGHAVVAVGYERRREPDLSKLSEQPTQAEFLSHFLVSDDQRGAYCRLPVSQGDGAGEYEFCLERDLQFLLVPLPSKVFMTAEIAEAIAWDLLSQVTQQRHPLGGSLLQPEQISGWNPNPTFYQVAEGKRLVARTYLTYGWRYKARMLRNSVSAQLKRELLNRDFPRYVWVTEFSLPDEAASVDPCQRLVRAHVVNDATGSRFWESTLVLDAPGLLFLWSFDPKVPADRAQQVVHALNDEGAYFPKIRGMDDFVSCLAPASSAHTEAVGSALAASGTPKSSASLDVP